MSSRNQLPKPDAWDNVLKIGPISATLLLKPAARGKKPPGTVNESKSELRIAGAAEEADLMAFCYELWEDNGQQFFSFDADKVRGLIRRSFERTGGLFAVIGEPGKIEGGALLLLDPYYYTSDFALFEQFSYVRPAFRQTRHAKTLVHWAMNMAENLKLLLFIGILSNTRTLAKVRLYRRMIGDPAGAYFVYRPKSLLGVSSDTGPVTGSASSSH